MQFRNLNIGQSFDFVNDSVLRNSFFKRCTKVGNNTYRDSDDFIHTVGTTRCEVFHIDRPERPYVSVVVKGTQAEAEWAAAARGVPFTFSNGTSHGEAVGYVPVDHLLAVMRWFGESGQAPFPVGACLLFSHHEAKEVEPVEIDIDPEAFEAEIDAEMAERKSRGIRGLGELSGWEEAEAVVNVGFQPDDTFGVSPEKTGLPVEPEHEAGGDAAMAHATRSRKLGSTMRSVEIGKGRTAATLCHGIERSGDVLIVTDRTLTLWHVMSQSAEIREEVAAALSAGAILFS